MSSGIPPPLSFRQGITLVCLALIKYGRRNLMFVPHGFFLHFFSLRRDHRQRMLQDMTRELHLFFSFIKYGRAVCSVSHSMLFFIILVYLIRLPDSYWSPQAVTKGTILIWSKEVNHIASSGLLTESTPKELLTQRQEDWRKEITRAWPSHKIWNNLPSMFYAWLGSLRCKWRQKVLWIDFVHPSHKPQQEQSCFRINSNLCLASGIL